MPKEPIVPISQIDFSQMAYSIDEIRKFNKQRFEMEQLSAIVRLDAENKIIIGYKDTQPTDFWVRGHIPGRPLMPGVIMIEAAAQLSSFYYSKATESEGADRFIGFGGVTDVKFRGQVLPGQRFVLMAKCIELRSRRAVFETQGFVDDKMVFEGTIIGMPM